MDIIKQLKDMFNKNILYPVTVTKAVYDENYNICDSTFTELYKVTTSCQNVTGFVNGSAINY